MRPRSARAKGAVSAVLVSCAIAVALGPWDAWIRVVVALGLIALSASCHRLLARRRRPPSGWLVVDQRGLHRLEHGGAATLVDFQEPFGLTVLSSPDRATLRIALTSASATRYVPAQIRDAEDAAAAPTVIARATTVADWDLRGADDVGLMAADAERLVVEVARRMPEALNRVFLSDASGEAIVLDGSELRVGSRRIDLQAPLEWRASFFQETLPHCASRYQATWVRQADVEVVLVAPVPADAVVAGGPTASVCATVCAAVCAAGEGPLVRRALARDLRLLQATAEKPPPRELRRAIDRRFMLPLRCALDRAPGPMRTGRAAPRPWTGTA